MINGENRNNLPAKTCQNYKIRGLVRYRVIFFTFLLLFPLVIDSIFLLIPKHLTHCPIKTVGIIATFGLSSQKCGIIRP